MAASRISLAVHPFRLPEGPVCLLILAAVLTLLGWDISYLADYPVAHGITALAALILAGAAVARRLQTAGSSLKERLWSGCLVFLAGCLAEVHLHFLPPDAGAAADWTSARMFLRALAGVGLAGAVLVVLPSLGRRIVVSLLVLFHFGGILSAVTSVEPSGAPAPWLSLQAWTVIYRPYLTFMYLNNAYHFYSPEPGPPNLLWFYVRYEDGQAHWVKLPVREECPEPLYYQRLLALTESTNMIRYQATAEPDFNLKLRRRDIASRLRGIPLHPVVLPQHQYREPQEYSKIMLASYARFAARHFKHLTDPEVKFSSVRIYRVTHNIIMPPELAEGYSPLEKSLYMPYYMGEFDPQGRLVDKDDPLLYWLIPIFREDFAAHLEVRGMQPEYKILDYLDVHKDFRSQPEEPGKAKP